MKDKDLIITDTRIEFKDDPNSIVMDVVSKELMEFYSSIVTQNKGKVLVAMSGGIDSALTASLFRDAGYRVIGVTLPIEQHPDETMRGVEACEKLGIEHFQVDLTEQFKSMCESLSHLDARLSEFEDESEKDTKIRRGNIRAN